MVRKQVRENFRYDYYLKTYTPEIRYNLVPTCHHYCGKGHTRPICLDILYYHSSKNEKTKKIWIETSKSYIDPTWDHIIE